MTPLTAEEIYSYIGKTVQVKMDQPIGSTYDGHGESITYPINYGFVPNTLSVDGAELDAYVVGVSIPLMEFTGTCIAVIRRYDEADDKLIVAPLELHFTDSQIIELTWFQERFYNSEILR